MIPLRFRGEVFRASGGQSTRGEVNLFAEKTTGTAHFDGREVAITGDVQIDDLRLAPRTPIMMDGFLRVHGVRPTAVKSGAVVVDPKLPPMVRAASAPKSFEVPCSELELGWGPEMPPTDGTVVHLAAGKTSELRATPKGPVVATLTVPRNAVKDAPIVRALEQKGKQTKIRLMGDETVVVAWVASSAIAKTQRGDDVPGLFVLHQVGEGTDFRGLTCSREVPVYFDDKTSRIGTFHAGATFYVKGFKQGSALVPVLLHSTGDHKLPVVQRADLEGCVAAR